MGFSGLIVVFRPEGMRNWNRAELTALWVLTSNGLSITFFATLPVILHIANTSNVWAISEMALGIYLALLAALTIWASRKADFFAAENRVPVISHILMFFTYTTPLLALSLIVAGLSSNLWQTQWFYSGALLAGVLVAGLEFLYFVALMVRSRSNRNEHDAA